MDQTNSVTHCSINISNINNTLQNHISLCYRKWTVHDERFFRFSFSYTFNFFIILDSFWKTFAYYFQQIHTFHTPHLQFFFCFTTFTQLLNKTILNSPRKYYRYSFRSTEYKFYKIVFMPCKILDVPHLWCLTRGSASTKVLKSTNILIKCL